MITHCCKGTSKHKLLEPSKLLTDLQRVDALCPWFDTGDKRDSVALVCALSTSCVKVMSMAYLMSDACINAFAQANGMCGQYTNQFVCTEYGAGLIKGPRSKTWNVRSANFFWTVEFDRALSWSCTGSHLICDLVASNQRRDLFIFDHLRIIKSSYKCTAGS